MALTAIESGRMVPAFCGDATVTSKKETTRFISRLASRFATRQPMPRNDDVSGPHHDAWTSLRNLARAPLSWRREHWILAAVAIALTVFVGTSLPTGASASHRTDNSTFTTVDIPLPALDSDLIAEANSSTDEPVIDDSSWQVVTVRSGQALCDIFKQQGLGAGDLQRLLENRDNASALRNIHPGDEFAFHRGVDGALLGIRFDRDEKTRVIVNFDQQGMHQNVQDRQVERRVHVAHGVVERSLFEAGEQSGMTDAMVLKLAGAFGYDIDFAQDLRQGDSFTVIYDDVFREGERLRDGDIIAATFINHGKRFSAFRYTDPSGTTMYYTEDGRPLRKAFLRTPVEFSRITSFFTAARMHPILGTMRAHRGVDYAAPPGTPIHSAGDGKIAFRGVQPGYGNVVIVQHGGHYSTLYGHMSRFAGIQVGQHVSQGQTIGFVGMTGLATGPHLHYEFRIDGQHRDPLTVTLPKPEPLPETELAQFRNRTQPMLAKLKTLEATQLASAK
jgi:murein DD-endopeptidase MepM/ murein hydrolase activator NlpD